MKHKVALITGTASGIGGATAAKLVAAGYAVYGTSRRGSAVGKRAFEMLARDVTSDASVQAVVSEVLRRAGRIDLLVNNAGFGVGLAGDEESSVAQAQAIFDTNFFGTVRMTRAVVPHMRRQSAGRIVNIGSGLGLVPKPYMAIYSASKHALEGYSESLDHELKIEEHQATRAALNKRYLEVVAAGDTPEAVAEVVLKAANAARPKLRYPVGSIARVQLLRRIAAGPPSSSSFISLQHWTIGTRASSTRAELVAQAAIRALQRGERTVVPGLFNELSCFFVRFVTRRFASRVATQVLGQPRLALPARGAT